LSFQFDLCPVLPQFPGARVQLKNPETNQVGAGFHGVSIPFLCGKFSTPQSIWPLTFHANSFVILRLEDDAEIPTKLPARP
jgi:hypothetical protein